MAVVLNGNLGLIFKNFTPSLMDSSPSFTKVFKKILIVRPKLMIIIISLLWRRKEEKVQKTMKRRGFGAGSLRFWKRAGCGVPIEFKLRQNCGNSILFWEHSPVLLLVLGPNSLPALLGLSPFDKWL